MFAMPSRGRALSACLLGFLGCAADASRQSASDPEIVGGADDTEHHSVAVIQFVGTAESGHGTLHCTGSLVAPDIILTAAHCIRGPSGTHSGWRVSFEAVTDHGTLVNPIAVREVLAHPRFNGWAGENDVALLFLER